MSLSSKSVSIWLNRFFSFSISDWDAVYAAYSVVFYIAIFTIASLKPLAIAFRLIVNLSRLALAALSSRVLARHSYISSLASSIISIALDVPASLLF